jgi:hypothetical protein
MPTIPQIRVVTVQFGPLSRARLLNPKFVDDGPILRATLDIVWEPADPPSALAGLEGTLLAFLPRFARHECRGAEWYHVFRRSRRRAPEAPARRVECPLALAHLIEHAIIEFICTICDMPRCSGATAARFSPPGRFDVLVECADPSVGRCCLALATAWLTLAVQGQALGPLEADVLAAARLAHDRRGRGVNPPLAARALGWSERRATRALGALSEVGYLSVIPCTMNLSGAPEYRVCPAEA